jgi:hypothetical protein
VVNAPTPSGPPEVQLDVVARHAEQFDVDLPDRGAGSQEELAAGSYILGHLQLAGFFPYLDGVPVGDQVRSTNVVALPPSGAEPRYLVTIAYDTGARHDDRGRYIGLFLELARAIEVAAPDHEVAFVAVGAESADRRGTRRLAQYLLDEGFEPKVLTIGLAIPEDEDALKAAGFEHEFVYGQVDSIAATLLRELIGDS